jgi:hypothetical protein
MPHSLDVPEDDESLYLIVGETADDTRPINQGDVFKGITLPGFPEDDHGLIILTTHPCSLRAGARLRPRLQASPVHRSRYLPPEEWAHSYLRQMPLPALVDDQHHMVTLTEAGIVTPVELMAAERIAVLSEAGILLLQQRLVWALAHAVIGRDTLADYSAPAFAQIELLEEWSRGLCAANEPDRPARLAAIAEEFEEYIRASGLQAQLADQMMRGDARRRVRDELRRRQQQ